MILNRSELLKRLAAMSIPVTTVEHPPSMTVEDNNAHNLALPGAHTKNLFLKDDKGALVLVVAQSHTKVDLKALGKRLGMGRFSFAKPDVLLTHLGVSPGAVTAFAIANDTALKVKLVLDETLLAADSINCHPLENNATTNIARDDLLRFIRQSGHEPQIVQLSV